MKKRSSKPYFVNKNGECYSVISGRYGNYARVDNFNASEKEMMSWGYEILFLTEEEANDYKAKMKERSDRMKAEELKLKLNQAAECVSICLSCKPLEIGMGNHLWEHITIISGAMLDAYHGCGSGLAFIKDGKIIAFCYGGLLPDNAPKCDAVQEVDFSCCQILF